MKVVVVDPERTGIPQPVQLVEMGDEFVVTEVEEVVEVVFLVETQLVVLMVLE